MYRWSPEHAVGQKVPPLTMLSPKCGVRPHLLGGDFPPEQRTEAPHEGDSRASTRMIKGYKKTSGRLAHEGKQEKRGRPGRASVYCSPLPSSALGLARVGAQRSHLSPDQRPATQRLTPRRKYHVTPGLPTVIAGASKRTFVLPTMGKEQPLT